MATPLDRLNVLLPWINGDHVTLTPRQVRKLLKRFLDSFDGSAEAGHVCQQYSGESEIDGVRVFEPWTYDEASYDDPNSGGSPDYYPPNTEEQNTIESELTLLHMTLREMLRKGLLEAGQSAPFNERLDTLTIGVRTAHRAEIKRRSASSAARRAYEGSGAYVLTVDGSIREVITFLVAHLLTMAGMVALAECPAPKPPKRGKGRCNRVVVVSAGGKGRPAKFCSAKCRVRYFRAAERAKERNTSKIRSGHRVTKGPRR